MKRKKSREEKRLQTPNLWERWGPYLADRSWGTVREDYSKNGDAWNFFPFDHAHKRAYRWTEDGIAGICDRYQILCFSWAFWNGKDPILKERYFGLTSDEGNHGEDVKEYYYYLDAAPTHSYLKFLYKYPFEEFPYQRLREENKKRSVKEKEFELIDTLIFEENRYFDIFIEYAKASEEDICIKIEVYNRSNEDQEIHILPNLWFRNRWGWGEKRKKEPVIEEILDNVDGLCLCSDDTDTPHLSNLPFSYSLGKRYLFGPKDGAAYFTDNETNRQALWNEENEKTFVKDAFHEKVVHKKEAINPEKKGTKACFHYCLNILANTHKTLYFRLTDKKHRSPLHTAEKVIEKRKKEADDFYRSIQSSQMSEEEKLIQRQALAGMIWSKQIYLFDVGVWLQGDNPKNPLPDERKEVRNNHWRHLNSMRIFSMPDKWEYPWFAAWDLAFHCLALMLVDVRFAKDQLWQLLFDQFIHPNGQIPAYEWEFGDVNPPLQAWVALQIFFYEKKRHGKEDYPFLEKCFHKMLLNFSWWVNKVDVKGNNVFEGGFLGLDNITVIDRSKKLPNGALLDQTDGSGWMGMFCLNMMRIALVLSKKNPIYESLATKFFEHYVYIGAAMRKGYWRSYDMWDEKDGWFYSYLNYPDHRRVQLRIRSLVGIIPFFAHEILTQEDLKEYPEFSENFHWFVKNRSDLVQKSIMKLDDSTYVFSFMSKKELQSFLRYIWDKEEFRSDYGLRSISKFHDKNPFSLGEHNIQYEPGESLEKIKGGNSNWRGPIWFPINYLFIHTLKNLSSVYKEGIIKDEEDKLVTLKEMSAYFSDALIRIFSKDVNNKRAVFGDEQKMQNDPNFQDYLLFFEHYHGDTGRGLGASHQTGWSGLIAKLIEEFR